MIKRGWLSIVCWPSNRSVLWGQSVSLVDWLFINRLLFFRVTWPWWRYWGQVWSSSLQIQDLGITSISRGEETLRNGLTPTKAPSSLSSAYVPHSGHYPNHQAPWEANPVIRAPCEPGEGVRIESSLEAGRMVSPPSLYSENWWVTSE